MLCSPSWAALSDGSVNHVDFFSCIYFSVISELVPSALQEGKSLEETGTPHPTAPSAEAHGGRAAWRGSWQEEQTPWTEPRPSGPRVQHCRTVSPRLGTDTPRLSPSLPAGACSALQTPFPPRSPKPAGPPPVTAHRRHLEAGQGMGEPETFTQTVPTCPEEGGLF